MTHNTLSLVPDPDVALFAELAVPDPATARLLLVAFSRLIGEARGRRGFVRDTCASLAGIGRLEYRRADGTLEPAPAPELDAFGWSDGQAALNRLGLTSTELDRSWDQAHAVDGVHATLPLATVLEFFPAELWPLCAQLLEWGPATGCERLERFARLEALRKIKPTRARPEGGTISAGTVDNLMKGCRRLLEVLCELQRRRYPSPALAGWAALPSPVAASELGAAEANTDRTAPPLLLVRRTLRRLTKQIERRSETKRGQGRLKRLLRKRLLLALLSSTGVRISALAAACVRDYDPEHRFPGGVVGPALRVFPGKSIAASEARWKALPPLVASWLEHYLEYLGIRDQPTATLWPSDRERGAKPMLPTSLGTLLAGEPGSNPPILPLLPREAASGYGYSAHTLRHLAEQLAYEVGHDYLETHPEARSFITPQVLADALLDHRMSSDRLGYKDLDTAEGRERWAREAALGLWEYLWGDKGARHAPDVDRIERAIAARDERRAEQAAVQARVKELRDRRRELERQGDHAGEHATAELVRLIFQLSAIAGALDDEHEEAERVQRELYAAELELQEARRTLVPIPDEAPDPQVIALEDERAPEPPAEPLRDWLTPAEAAHAFAVSEPTMRRWFRGQLPHAEGDPRNPWAPSDVERVIERHGPRKQRLVVSQLDRSRIAPEVMRAIKEMLLLPPS
jgi:integrase